jgi:hypothetical protein
MENLPEKLPPGAFPLPGMGGSQKKQEPDTEEKIGKSRDTSLSSEDQYKTEEAGRLRSFSHGVQGAAGMTNVTTTVDASQTNVNLARLEQLLHFKEQQLATNIKAIEAIVNKPRWGKMSDESAEKVKDMRTTNEQLEIEIRGLKEAISKSPEQRARNFDHANKLIASLTIEKINNQEGVFRVSGREPERQAASDKLIKGASIDDVPTNTKSDLLKEKIRQIRPLQGLSKDRIIAISQMEDPSEGKQALRAEIEQLPAEEKKLM